ncbi:MAG TPA: hypothetical protein VEC35_00195 [Noviherbaspirillum sp.]|nr:hypothetical protein [Noviherbaspirillum sp.]
MKPNALTPVDATIGLAVVAFTALLAALPLVLERPQFKWALSEQGPFEQLSIVGWLFAAAVVMIGARPPGRTGSAFALLFVVFAAREADWHKAFTADSILKTNYYRHALAPMHEKIAAGVVAMAVIALIVYVGFLIFRFLFLRGGLRTRAGFWLLLTSILMVLGKILDRTQATLAESFGVLLPPLAQLYVQAFDDGFEMADPLLMAWAMWLGKADGLFDR